jgi:hypothetical protein
MCIGVQQKVADRLALCLEEKDRTAVEFEEFLQAVFGGLGTVVGQFVQLGVLLHLTGQFEPEIGEYIDVVGRCLAKLHTDRFCRMLLMLSPLVRPQDICPASGERRIWRVTQHGV